jgi:protein-disulfide isomerase-like protein with CxxC motif
MRTLVVYKEDNEHARSVDTFLHDFMRRTGRELDTINPDTREGANMCRTYDIIEYPTVIALDDNGTMQHLWRGLPLPTISEVSYYVQ